jgi:type VI secretion system protein ImpF
MIKGFEPSLFDKLFDDPPLAAVRRKLSLDELKDSVARDLEALLNTRVVFDAALAQDFPWPRPRSRVSGWPTSPA